MRILALDTTSAFGSIALLEDATIVEEVPLHSPDGFSQVLFPYVERLLEKHGWALDSIDCFAAAAGPGSFTGVRVGLTAVKGLAEALGARAMGVSNLEALASCGSSAVRAVVIDARRGEVYGAVYGADGSVIVPETVSPFREWVEGLPAHVTEIVSADFGPFRAHFSSPVPVTELRTLAAAVGRIAQARGCNDPAALDANYVRRSDAELFWTDK